eukprot:7324929-Lingulodinium_polyedra.AAC.1
MPTGAPWDSAGTVATGAPQGSVVDAVSNTPSVCLSWQSAKTPASRAGFPAFPPPPTSTGPSR